MTSFENLIANQKELSAAIESVYTNFKKDGSDRKTADHIKRRLNTLDSYWSDYCRNYAEFSAIGLDAPTWETVKREMERVKERYDNIRAHIQNYQPHTGERSQTPVLKTPTFVHNAPEAQQKPGLTAVGTVSKTEEMLKKQQSNFKALHRTLTHIELESVSEKWELEDLLRSVQSRWNAIDSLHWDLDSELNGSNQEYESAFCTYEQKYNDIKKAINKKIWSIAHIGQTTPKIEIPTFNGNYNNWVSFKDLFNETVHNNPSMSNAQKMQYLKSKVRGEAEKIIQHLPISSDNYTACWELLNQRYHNKNLIFTSHMHTMMNIPTMQQKSVTHLKRIHDTTLECLNAIKNLGVDISSWDPILVYSLTQKLDSESYSDYVESVENPRELPVLKEFLDYLEIKFTTLETSRRKQDNSTQKYQVVKHHSKQQNNNYNQRPNFYKNTFSTSSKMISQSANNKNVVSAKYYHCSLCNSNEHGIYFCKKFLLMPSFHRLKTIRKLNLCPNCLFDHQGKQCFSGKVCRDCNQDHNSLLHEAFSHSARPATDRADAAGGSARGVSASVANTSQEKQVRSSSHVSLQNEPYEVLLPTAIIEIQSADGTYQKMRALLDQGSQISLITENAAQLLNIPRRKCKGVVSGIGDKESLCKGMITIHCSSTVSDYRFETDVLIMKNLIKHLPSQTLSKPNWTYLDQIKLADPEFYRSRPVDVLLGADIYSNILMDGIYRENSTLPTAQQTKLGWILSGNARTFQCNVVLNNIEQIQKFWEIEEISEESDLSSEDKQCIAYYQETTVRREDGRYEVRLPLKSDYQENLGDSKSRAIAQFYKLEQRFRKNTEIASNYKSFIDEYLQLGHMIPSADDCNMIFKCYLPHHCVTREDSTTTKLRVVFNASQETSTGSSLNDVMCRGPNLQQDLQSLIIKWRQYKFVFTADIEKMFRQIWVNQDDQYLQMIIWRDHQSKILQEYKLATVTYGTKAAPFLAMMTLKQLARDEKANYQNSSAPSVIEESFYMDDLIHGSYSIQEARKIQTDLINLLKSGGFNLRKWKSNAPELLTGVETDQKNQENFDFKQAESSKALGLGWNPQNDHFTFQSKVLSSSPRPTKRSLLSDISKLYDPLGWLAPLTTKLKILFQDVWKAKVQWDEPAPQNICNEWNKIKNDIEAISQCHIPRWLQTQENDQVELHGFCDASTQAYAGVVYCKTNKKSGTTVTLVAAKAKVVPLSKNISLPRLELCGAVLLSKLMSKIVNCLKEHDINIFGWTDSTAVLGWLNGEAHRWKPFVANRVKQVTAVIQADSWNYVKSKENPADSASRGLTASQLKEHALWWQGPEWLPSYKSEIEKQHNYYTNQEMRKIKQVNVMQLLSGSEVVKQILEKQSSLSKAIKVLAWVLRFAGKGRKQDYLSLSELSEAKNLIIKSIQEQEFSDEINNLTEGKTINSKSNIYSLNPILDENGILRVGGRLRHANLDPETKHPAIIPCNTRLVELIIDQAHMLTYHGGARLTTAYIRQKYWVIRGYNATKKRLRSCVKCRKNRPTFQPQIMGDLPSSRTNPSRPFFHCGVDYTGHVNIKANKGRGVKTTKGYVAVFICMATKAVHMELVSDLTSSAFLAALKRMAARRGLPGHIYSDQGTNFVGANKILKQEFEELKQVFNQEFMTEVASMGIEWHFNAPSWPSAGGLWEAAVKSLKHHLKRVIGEQNLTFEEFTTLLNQLEGCLNSRPLCPLSEDPNDLDFLTPSHFLASGPTLTLYETETDLRTRWHLTQKIFKDVWSRWRDEYLTQLSARCKWRQPQTNIKKDDVVLIKEDNLPPGKWALGRVVQLHPGNDGFVRVVTLKTKNGLMKRPVIKLSILPVHQNENQEIPKQQQNQNTKPILSRKGKSLSLTSLLLTLFFLFISVPTSQCAYNIMSLQNNNSIYFDRITNMHLIRDNWRLIVYYSTEPYQAGNTTLMKYTTYLDNLCMKIRTESHCESIMLQLHHEVTELQYYNDLLMNHNVNTTSRRRRRRGLVDGVGYLANGLFGILDSRFAEKYERDINLIRENQKHLATLWKNQTSVVEAEFNMLKRTESLMDKHHKLINTKFNAIDRAVNKLKGEVEKESLITDFLTTAMIAHNILFSLKSIQQTLLDTVTNIYNGKFNFHLLTPDQLRSELGVISEQLPKDLSLPLKKTDSLSEIYNLLQVRTRVTTNFIIFEIQIPLIGEDKYEISKIISIPRLADQNTEAAVVPVSNYVAVNLKRDAYLKITEQDLNLCTYRNPEIILCRIKRPIYLIKDDKSFCELLPNTRDCEIITKPCSNKWVELHKLNTYLYFCCAQCQLKLVCDDQITPVQMTHAGFFNVNQGCTIKSADFFVYSHRLEGNKLSVSSNVLLPEISQINHIINVTLPDTSSLNLDPSDLKEHKQQIKDIQEKLEIMKKNPPSTSGVSYNDVHHYSAIYILYTLAAVIVVAWVWRRYRCRRMTVATAPAAPCAAPPVPAAQPRSVVQCSDHYSEVSEFTKSNSRKSIKSKVQGARVSVTNTGSSPIVRRPTFILTDDQISS